MTALIALLGGGILASAAPVEVITGVVVAAVLAVVAVAVRRRGRAGPDERPGDVTTQAPARPEAEPEARDSAPAEAAPIEAEAPAAEVGEAPVEPAPPPRLRERLARSRATLAAGLAGLVGRGLDDDDAWEQLEESLIAADVGVQTASRLVGDLRERVGRQRGGDGEVLRASLRDELLDVIGTAPRTLDLEPSQSGAKPGIVLVVGVNGTGKTTTVGKLALALGEEGKTTVLAASDTFRAAAGDQIALWADRVGAPLVRQHDGADPAAVAFDALASARARGADVLLVDTAGRLHSKTNLMEELKKIRRVLERDGGDVREVLLVLDATTGQNGLAQAREFRDAVGVTGLVLTKLDGTARGGIVIAVQQELGLPVKLVGLGEGPRDLAVFDPEAFVDALLAPDN